MKQEIANLLERAGREAFEAYDTDRGGVNHLGKPTPKWKDLPPEIRHAWQASVLPILRDSTKQIEGILDTLKNANEELTEAVKEMHAQMAQVEEEFKK